MDAGRIPLLFYNPTRENINRWTELLAQAGYSDVTVAHTYRNARRLIKFSGSRIVICTVPDNYGLVLSLINRELTGSTFRAPADFCCICERSSRAEKVLRYCSTVYGVRLISSADQPLALCDRLEEILKHGSRHTSDRPKELILPAGMDTRSFSERIETRFAEIGIPPGMNGYAYLKLASEILCHDRSCCQDVTKILYPRVAEAFGVSTAQVECAMRRAIASAWDTGCYEEQAYYFSDIVDTRTGWPRTGSFLARTAATVLAEDGGFSR